MSKTKTKHPRKTKAENPAPAAEAIGQDLTADEVEQVLEGLQQEGLVECCQQRPTLDPNTQTLQGRPLRLWYQDVRKALDEMDRHQRISWFSRSMGAATKLINAGDMEAKVSGDIYDECCRILDGDPQWVYQWLWFACCSSRYWSADSLAQYLCAMAGYTALVHYVEKDDFPMIQITAQETE